MSTENNGDADLAADLESKADERLHGQPTTAELLELGKLFATARADRARGAMSPARFKALRWRALRLAHGEKARIAPLLALDPSAKSSA